MIQTKDHFQKITKIFADENFPFYSHIAVSVASVLKAYRCIFNTKKMARPVRPICLVVHLQNIVSSITGNYFYFEVQSPSIHVARSNIPDARLGL